MEEPAEIERHRLLAVPGAHDHGALERDAVDRLLEGGGTAAGVDGDVRAAPASQPAQSGPIVRGDRHLRTTSFGERAPQRRRLDSAAARARATHPHGAEET